MYPRLAVAVLVVVAVLAMILPAAAAEVPERCTTESFRPFAAKVWDAPWQRGAPTTHAIQAKRARVRCAPPAHRRAMLHIWDRRRDHYYAFRERKRRQARLDAATPYGKWAIPGYIVACESGGDFRAYNSGYEPNGPGSGPGGAYQIIWQTWNAYAPRRFVDHAQDASRLEQHLIAGMIWDDVGASAWDCA